MRDLDKALADASDDDGLTWKPQVGDKLTGIVRTRDTVTSKYAEGPQEHLVVDARDKRRWHVYGRNVMLARLIRDLDPQPGDGVGIERLPDKPDKKHHVFKMIVAKSGDDAESGADAEY